MTDGVGGFSIDAQKMEEMNRETLEEGFRVLGKRGSVWGGLYKTLQIGGLWI